MIRQFLKSKIHRATVTETDLEYNGSLTVDLDLLDAAEIAIHEVVEVYNITRGTRFKTYAIEGKRGSGEICVNGAAAHLAELNDLIIIVTYCDLDKNEVENHKPTVVIVDGNNRIIH